MARGILIGGIAILIVLGAFTFGFVRDSLSQAVTTEPSAVAAAADEIASFNLPARYTTDYAVHFLGFTLAAFKPADGNGHIMLVQAPPGVHINQQELEQYAVQVDRNQITSEVQTISEVHRLIRGQDATVTVGAGTNSEAQPYRQLSTIFEGRRGTAMLVVNEPLTEWDEDAITQFLASIG